MIVDKETKKDIQFIGKIKDHIFCIGMMLKILEEEDLTKNSKKAIKLARDSIRDLCEMGRKIEIINSKESGK